jgi:hypothetical protein
VMQKLKNPLDFSLPPSSRLNEKINSLSVAADSCYANFKVSSFKTLQFWIYLKMPFIHARYYGWIIVPNALWFVEYTSFRGLNDSPLLCEHIDLQGENVW